MRARPVPKSSIYDVALAVLLVVAVPVLLAVVVEGHSGLPRSANQAPLLNSP
jgi:hypothetical protein